ncbi:MAG: ABC transporter ATP-binding protein [Planctomycetota bacterium]|nr:ABC transporter ATP-binding protein [Planctomycetota bacterium]
MVANAQTPVIECRGLTKVFKDFWLRPRVTAVDGLDLVIEPHQVFGLLGPNGSGKSTTIKMILGLLFPTKGRIAIFGKLPTDVETKARIGYLPEESYLYRFLNARETLDFYGRIFNLPRSERNKRIDMLLEMVGLEGVQRRPVGEYSKGMQRRIGLAQALINDPDLLILDEPTTGLDPLGTRQIKDLILHLKQRGKTVLLCSHLLADVEDVCDRVTVLYGGRIRALGTIEELLSVSDSTQIETERLEPALVAKVRELIEKEHRKVHKVEAPRRKLEALFLEIVQKALSEGAATSGAKTGGAVAEFLAAGAAPAPADEGRQVIAGLVEAAKPAPPPEVSKPEPAAPAADARVLDALTAPKPEAKPASEEKPSPPKAVDRSVIDDLLKKDDPS